MIEFRAKLESLKILARYNDENATYLVSLKDDDTGKAHVASALPTEFCAIMECAIRPDGEGLNHAIAEEWCKNTNCPPECRPIP